MFFPDSGRVTHSLEIDKSRQWIYDTHNKSSGIIDLDPSTKWHQNDDGNEYLSN